MDSEQAALPSYIVTYLNDITLSNPSLHRFYTKLVICSHRRRSQFRFKLLLDINMYQNSKMLRAALTATLRPIKTYIIWSKYRRSEPYVISLLLLQYNELIFINFKTQWTRNIGFKNNPNLYRAQPLFKALIQVHSSTVRTIIAFIWSVDLTYSRPNLLIWNIYWRYKIILLFNA